MKYKIEFLPRYGTIIGVIWRIKDEKEDSIGHIRVEAKEERELWTRIIDQLNQELKKETKKLPAQKSEQDIY